jgi:hypothetical protein
VRLDPQTSIPPSVPRFASVIQKMHDTVFVVGAPRSGTTLFRLILDSHPRVVAPGEYDFLFDFPSEGAKPPDVGKYTEWLSTHRMFRSLCLTIDPDHEYHDLVRSFVRQKAQSNCVVALNIHRPHHRIPFFFPEAKYIHLVRDPRDVALSTIAMGWAGNVFFAVDRWVETESAWNRLALGIEKSRTLELRYEKLCSNPEQTLRVVCDFLNIAFDKDMLNYFRHSSYGSIHANSVGKWKKTVTRDELATVEHKVSALLLDRGYALSGVQTRRPSKQVLAVLWMRNKAHQWRFRGRRYGLGTLMVGKIAHALGMKWLNRRVQLAMNEIDTLYLK